MSNNKLHPIYVALDVHQYHRAIKLASALPDSNALGKALLAHAYSKSGQRYLALVTLNKILGGHFYELKHEADYSLQAVQERLLQSLSSNNKVPSQPEPAPTSSSSKKGKRGKKKPVVKQQPAQPVVKNDAPKWDPKWDLVDQLNTPPSLPEQWETLPPAEKAITHETTLATLSVTLHTLKLPFTAYQMYSWAATAEPNEALLTKTYCLGLSVLAAPSKWTEDSYTKMETHVLAHIQAVALQWARLAISQEQPHISGKFPMMLATAWASQTALWQLQWLPADPQRSLILPRLAESMARRLIQQEEGQSQSAETRLLLLRNLEHQSKWSEMLEDVLEQLPVNDEEQQQPPTSEFGVSLTAHQILTEKARVLLELKRYDDAQTVYENLLHTSPDDWSCWKGHLECCSQNEKVDVTNALVDATLIKLADSKYPIRGPHLMIVELAAHQVRILSDDDSLRALAAAIQSYSELFAPRAACAFSDLETYIDLLLSASSSSSHEVVQNLLKLAETMRKGNDSQQEGEEISNKERQTKLRAYTFALKMNHTVLSKHADLVEKWLPEWTELITGWKASLSLASSNEGEETQKELKPGDELALLTVQQLLYRNPDDMKTQVACAVLLETAIQHSPDNAYLKIAAIDVYYQLNAMSRSWEFFQVMGVKHIQLDSCIYPILPFLLEGGLYNETIEVCNALLRFQASTARDCGDFAGRAMEAGTLSKANEFMVFQRHKMNKSLSVMEAKGLILDAAALLANVVPRMKHDEDPMLQGGLGIHQGVVGGDDDMGRATQMVVEVHNPYAALSLVSWADNGGSAKDSEEIADNRDMSILCHQILYKTKTGSKESIVQDTLRRGHIHGILIRATLCLDASKGPKKGKIVKSSEELDKRTNSLLEGAQATADFVENHELAEDELGVCCKALVHTTLELCRVLAIINAGHPKLDNDSMEQREQHASDLLRNKALMQLKQAKEHMSLKSVKVVCSLLPNYIVPLFALFRMCSTSCTLYGWSKRKRNTKRCAGAMADVAVEFKALIQELLKCVNSLPSSESTPDAVSSVQEEHAKFFDDHVIRETTDLITQAQYRTRMRVEPVLQEMDEYLDAFNVSDD